MNDFIPLYEFCHNTKSSNTLYSKVILTKETVKGQSGVIRPLFWAVGNLYEYEIIYLDSNFSFFNFICVFF